MRTYEDLERYLREFTNFNGDPAPYDFDGAFHLFLALLDNLARNYLDGDLQPPEDGRSWLTDEQIRFLDVLRSLRGGGGGDPPTGRR